MPVAEIGQPLNLGGGSQFLRLKSKGDKVQFRLAKGAVYEGKHFLTNEQGETEFSYCARIMTQGAEKCPTCEKFFELKREAKETPDKSKREELLQDASKKYGVKISFYWPIVDRADGKAKILQTSLSVRSKFESMVEAGVNILDSDFILLRTETPGADYYSLIRVDSKDTKELSKEEKEELTKAKNMDLEEILGHSIASSMETE